MSDDGVQGLAMGAILALPLLLALLAGAPRLRPAVAGLTPWAPLPALLAALFLPDGAVTAPALLLGLRLGLDASARAFLAASALLWLAAGLARAPTRRALPLVAWHLTLAGNLGAIVALDRAGFYFWFALLSLAVYVLIADHADAHARRAGRLYLGVAIGAELLALAAFLLLTAGGFAETAALLLLFGLGAKLGVLPLHFPLPLVYAAATPAVGAAFAGALALGAAAGLLRFLPAAPHAADTLLVVGLATAFVGVALGLTQREPRALLGYSTVSQNGSFTAGLGLALALPERGAALAALALFAVHHALVKGALVLGAGGGRRALPWLIALSLALAAVPFTGGALAKAWLEELAPHAGPALWLHRLLPLTSVATLLLMARFVVLAARAEPAAQAAPAVFPPLALAALLLPVGLAYLWHPVPAELFTPTHPWVAAWPPLLGLVLAVAAWRWPPPWQPSLPPGDVAALLPPTAARWRWLRRRAPRWPVWRPGPDLAWLARAETRIRALPLTGVLFFALVLALLALGLMG